MEWTDRHCRYFHRLLTRHALIYTEMLTTGAVLHGDRGRLLAFDPFEHPVGLRLADAIRRRLRNRPASAPISGTTRLISTSVARLIAFKKAGSEPA
jgi:tRNA-dihydrouridine synthase